MRRALRFIRWLSMARSRSRSPRDRRRSRSRSGDRRRDNHSHRWEARCSAVHSWRTRNTACVTPAFEFDKHLLCLYALLMDCVACWLSTRSPACTLNSWSNRWRLPLLAVLRMPGFLLTRQSGSQATRRHFAQCAASLQCVQSSEKTSCPHCWAPSMGSTQATCTTNI